MCLLTNSFENYYYGKNLKYSFLRQVLSTQIIFCEKFRGVNKLFIATQKLIIIFFFKKISVMVVLRVLILLIILIPDRFYIFIM